MTSITQPNSAIINPVSQSKQFLEDGDTVEQMSNAIKNSDNLDQFLHNLKIKNVSQVSEEAPTATGSPVKGQLSFQSKSPSKPLSVALYDPFHFINSSDEEECTFQPKINHKSARIAKRDFVGDANEMLYTYAAERTMKQQEFVAMDAQIVNSRSLVNKSDKKSIRMVLKKIQTAISNIIADVEDDENQNVLNFESVGTVLHRLGVFQSLEFSNNKNGEKSSLTINYDKVKPERLSKEIAFHENFWKICSLPSLITDFATSELVGKLLSVLVEEKTAAAETAAYLMEILNIALGAVGLKGDGEQSAYEVLKKEKGLWGLQKIVSEFRQLFDNKTLFMSLYNGKKEILTTEDLNNKYYNQPHTPQVSKKSTKIDATQWKPKFVGRLENTVANLTQKDLRTRNNRLYKYTKYLQDQKIARLEGRIAEELKPCTFVPKTTPYKKKNAPYDTHNDSKIGYFSQSLAESSIANRHVLLYEVAKTYKEKLQQKSYAYKKKEEETEMEQCSFQPKLNRTFENSPTRNQDFYESIPKGFKKTVERLHLGTHLKETRQAEAERVPCGENYEKNREAEFAPPTFLQRPKIQKDEVLVYVDVSIGPGKTGRIGIHKGDNAKELAKNFARTYSLNATMRESLEKLLQSYIDSYFSQSAPQEQVAEQKQDEEEQGEEDDEDGEEDDEEENDDEEDN